MTDDSTTTTEVGSYFITNYPPFSLWRPENVPDILAAFERKVNKDSPLGLYIHIPFCRRRCKFCYFRVYTDQNAKSIEDYLQALIKEVALLSEQPGIAGRNFKIVYFGGGTPSYLSSRQLRSLRDRLHASTAWDQAQEVTFECEPGTLSFEKVKTLRDIGITRVSLGVENFNDTILEENGRAHLSQEIMRSFDWIQHVGFPQVNVDLIAGMIGESDENWSDCVERVRKMSPDNITIYQMELPFNTVISQEMKQHGTASPVADWATKRRWVNEAIDTLLAAGYHISSGNELVKDPATDRFLYRDNLFRGADLLGAGVASFGHYQGVHYQNLDQLQDYVAACNGDQLPINRALMPTPHQLLIREMVLQLKEGRISGRPFREKFGVDIFDQFGDALRAQQAAGYLTIQGDDVILTRRGLLQVDSLLPEYFEEPHRNVRYT